MAVSFCAAITIDHTKVSSTLTNFTMPWKGNVAIKSVANGGSHVQSANGYDIQFFGTLAGSVLSSPLNFELAPGTYDPTTGLGKWFIQIPSVSSSVDTVIYVGVDDASATNQSSAAAWDSNFKGAYHCGTAASLSLTDSVVSGIGNGTNVSMGAGGASFGSALGASWSTASGSGHYGTLPAADLGFTAGTIEWNAYITGGPLASPPIGLWGQIASVNTPPSLDAQIYSDNKYYIGWYSGSDYRVSVTHALSANTWYRFMYAWTVGGAGVLYVNGTSVGSVTVGAVTNINTTIYVLAQNTTSVTIGNGAMDEFRVSNVNRGASYAGALNAGYADTLVASLGSFAACTVGGGGGGSVFVRSYYDMLRGRDVS